MKIKVDEEVVLELSDTQKKIIKNDIPDDIFDEDMKRRVAYIISHKYEQCFKRLKDEWEPILAKKHASLPTDETAFAELVFAEPTYKSKSQKIAESPEAQ